MGVEHERKFLVHGEPPASGPVAELRQAYVAVEGDRTVRVREEGGRATLTVKDGRGVSRTEIETDLDPAVFAQLWALAADRSVAKRRRRVPLAGGLVAEVDEFAGRHEGLRLVEVEFPTAGDAHAFTPPPWFGPDVTAEPWAANAWLALHGLPDHLRSSTGGTAT